MIRIVHRFALLAFVALFASCSGAGGELAPDAGPRAGFDLAAAAALFPDSLRHWSGAMAPRDRTRLLFHFRAPKTRSDLEEALATGGLELEPDPPGAQGWTVLHTDTEAWVRSRSREPLDGGLLRDAGLRLGPELGWVGAVFRLPGRPDSATASDSLGSLYCPLPHALRVFPAPGYAGPPRLSELLAAVERHGLEPVPGDTLAPAGLGLRWTGAPEANVYRLADSLPVWESARIAGTSLENAPLLLAR